MALHETLDGYTHQYTQVQPQDLLLFNVPLNTALLEQRPNPVEHATRISSIIAQDPFNRSLVSREKGMPAMLHMHSKR